MFSNSGFGSGTNAYAPPNPNMFNQNNFQQTNQPFGFNMNINQAPSTTQSNPLADFGGFMSSSQPPQNQNFGNKQGGSSVFD